jgi:hypothetical protein
MKHISSIQHALDVVIGRRLFTLCWLSASLGVSIVQMRSLAQAWLVLPHALAPACLMSAWVLGSLVELRVPGAPRVWGSSTLGGILLWLIGPALVPWHLFLGLVSPTLVSMAALATLAVFLGASSTAWLSQQRSWPGAGERLALARSLVGLTVGLVVAWMLPAVAGLIALTCCLPLVALDFLLSGCAPLPRSGSVAACWVGRYWNADRWQLQLDQRGLPRNWWWTYLVERSQVSRWYLPLTLLASGATVILGGVWGAVPTPFAANLGATHTLDKLAWLLGGQLVILALGTCLLCAARNVIGFPDRLLPVSQQSRVRTLALLMPMGMAGSLVALGLPFLQAPWWLAVSLASYTLAGAVWGILLPRLRPTFGVEVAARRHLLLEQHMRLPDPMQLAYGRAYEARARLLLTTFEGMLIAVITPLSGWMIDWLGSVDDVLVMVGLVFVLGLGCFVLRQALFVFAHRLTHTRAALAWQRLRLTGSSFPTVNVAADR